MKVTVTATSDRTVSIEGSIESIADLAIAANPDYLTRKRSKPDLALLREFGMKIAEGDNAVYVEIQRRQNELEEASDGGATAAD